MPTPSPESSRDVTQFLENNLDSISFWGCGPYNTPFMGIYQETTTFREIILHLKGHLLVVTWEYSEGVEESDTNKSHLTNVYGPKLMDHEAIRNESC